MAEAVRVQQARQSRGRRREVETGDRRRAALAHRRAPGDRGGGRRPRAQPHAGARTPELRPHRLSPDGVGATASTRLIGAPRCRDELLDGEIFYSLAEAKAVIEAWRRHYNTRRPHSALAYKPPAPKVALGPALPAIRAVAP